MSMSMSISSSSSKTFTAVIVVAVMTVMVMMATMPSLSHAFTVPTPRSGMQTMLTPKQTFRLGSSSGDDSPPPLTVISDPMADALEQEQAQEDEIDEELKKQLAKAKRAQELREQEVFMKKSTGIHKCTNCDWQYDESKGDSMMIGGMIKPGTAFTDLPADWRCPVCRASKDAFAEVVEEIPGFEVNQGYGFGTNSWTSGQKNLAIFGGLGVFFLLFLSGYAMS